MPVSEDDIYITTSLASSEQSMLVSDQGALADRPIQIRVICSTGSIVQEMVLSRHPYSPYYLRPF